MIEYIGVVNEIDQKVIRFWTDSDNPESVAADIVLNGGKAGQKYTELQHYYYVESDAIMMPLGPTNPPL